MPSSTLEYAVAAQERALNALRQTNSAALEAVENWAKSVQTVAPELPAIPVLSSLPAPDELLKNSFDFAGQVLTAQREFAQGLLAATAPVVKTTPVEVPSAK
ncbi:MAG: hypothetical protein U0237_10200 [Thermoleophilia bacterium]